MKKIYFLFILISTSQILKSQITEEWAAEFDTSNYDYGQQVKVDQIGNVYVTGHYYHTGEGANFLTVKYDANGNRLWLKSYNGPSTGNDFAKSLAIDQLGNVYVTGSSKGAFPNNTDYDCFTIKYDSNGNELWTARYDSGNDNEDEGYKIEVDAIGNVYVAGFSNEGLGNLEDIITIKYNAAGVQQWVNRYDGTTNNIDYAFDLKVNSVGDIFITGRSNGTSADIVTIKYNTIGVQQWIKRYDGPTNGYDQPSALVIDNSSNVYVVGFASTTNGTDFITIKYDAVGVEKWNKLYHSYSDDFGIDIAVDASGNVFTTGYSNSSSSSWNYTTLKYDANGNQQWLNSYNGAGSDNDQAYGITIDGNGNVCVTGISYIGWGNQSDYATIKYSNSGNQEWLATYDSPFSGDDSPQDIIADNSGNIYVTGIANLNLATVKYSSTTGISDNKLENILFSVYPNPNNGQFTISLEDANSKPYQLEILNSLGEIVYTENIDTPIKTIEVNEPSGVYFARMISSQGVEIKSLIIK